MAGKKKAPFSKAGIESLAQNKPVVYKIRNRDGTHTYTGVAKRGHVAQRLKEHLPGGTNHIPGGSTVEIRQTSSIAEAREAEAGSIKRSQPKYHHVLPSAQGGWEVKKGRASRASRHFGNQAEAIEWGRSVSRNQGSELYIHKKDGTIQEKESHRRDPTPPRDRDTH